MPDFITATGTINISGALSALEDSSDDIVTAKGSIFPHRVLPMRNTQLQHWDYDEGDYNLELWPDKIKLDPRGETGTFEFRRKLNIVEGRVFTNLGWQINALTTGTQNAGCVRVNTREFVSGYDADPDDILRSGRITSVGASFALFDTAPPAGVQYLYVVYTFEVNNLSWDITCELNILQLREFQSAPIMVRDNGNWLGHGTINVSGSLSEADLHKVSPLNGRGTMSILGSTLAAGYTDPNLKFAFGSISVSASLDSGSPYSRDGTMLMTSSLSAIGRLTKEANVAMQADMADFSSSVFVGPGTIDGQKRAIIREAFGSLQIYNNSRGGFYSVGDSQQLKEAYGLINVTGSLAGKGTRDATKFATGSISVTGALAGDGTSLGSGSIDV